MITTPTLILDEEKCKANIKRMVDKANQNNIVLRPHFKTHQSLEIGRWFKDIGVQKITASSLTMADYFSSEWDDITVAFPTNILEIEKINDLASRITLNLLVESEQTMTYLGKNANAELGIFIKIDVGTHRSGINPEKLTLINDLVDITERFPLLKFKGFLGHAGHTYHCRRASCIKEIHNESQNIMTKLRSNFMNKYPNLIISLGDTPGCSIGDNFSGLDEIRPGNFVFYDLTQSSIGSNSNDQIAVAVACPIVAIHEDRSEIVIYGGGVHFSKDRLENEPEGTIFGRVAKTLDKGWGNVIPGMYLKKVSQEHGILSVPKEEIKKYKIGDVLMVLPVHSCMTADLLKRYLTLDNRWISMLK